MPKNQAVWGIDIGQAGLKAIRLGYAEAAQQVLATAFDYVPHPKILSQPDAVPEELIAQSLETFLSRNDVKGDVIAISVPGQTALARFIQLPPVETKKVSEIVKYEARQQIPFALEDVIWDYQTLGGGVEESGFMLGAEVGLFAMKREQVMNQLQPFLDAKLEVELVQISPLGLLNFVCHDQLGIRVDKEFESSDEYSIVLDMGTDNTTLLVTNGKKIWIRNVPIGGNHFTRALTKELKLTFAKAEHLKINATKSSDPRVVFQALRPVFNDYVAEIQRSIGYFSSVHREAKITRIYGSGNGFNLAGLQKFLQQNLQYEVERIDSFQGLVGDAVLNAPLFQENIMSFVVPYGVALQAMKLTNIQTTLLPTELATARQIRRKKPWAVVTAATLLLGLATSVAGNSNVAKSVSTDRFDKVTVQVDELKKKVSSFKSSYSKVATENEKLKQEGDRLVHTLATREYWPEVYRALNECLPRDVGDQQDVTLKNRVNIISVTAKRVPDLFSWWTKVSSKDYMLPQDVKNLPKGTGYVFTLKGEHYHHEPDNMERQGIIYVKDTLLKNLQKWTVQQPGTAEPVPVRKLGISHALFSKFKPNIETAYFPKGPRASKRLRGQIGGGFPGSGGSASSVAEQMMRSGRGASVAASSRTMQSGKNDDSQDAPKMIKKTTFTLEFVWKPTPPAERLDQEAVPAEAKGKQTAKADKSDKGAVDN